MNPVALDALLDAPDARSPAGMNYSLGSPPETRCPSFGLTLQEAYRLLRGAPAASQVVRTAVLGSMTWLLMEAATAAQHGLPAQRDAALEDMGAIMGACGMADPMLRPIIEAVRAVTPECAPHEGEAEKREISLAWLLRQLRAHCLAGVGLERGDAETLRIAPSLGVTFCPWIRPASAEGIG